MLKNLQYSDDERQIEADNPEKTQRLLISALLGEKISPQSSLVDAISLFEKKVGGKEQAQAIFKNIDGSLKVAAADGAVNLAALFNDQNVDSKTGRIDFSFAELSSQAKSEIDRINKNPQIIIDSTYLNDLSNRNLDDLRSLLENRLYFSEETSIGKLTGLEDLFGANGLKTKTGETDRIAFEQLKKVFSSAKSNIQFHPRFVTSLNNLYNRDQSNKNTLSELIENHLNDQAKDAIIKVINGYKKP